MILEEISMLTFRCISVYVHYVRTYRIVDSALCNFSSVSTIHTPVAYSNMLTEIKALQSLKQIFVSVSLVEVDVSLEIFTLYLTIIPIHY